MLEHGIQALVPASTIKTLTVASLPGTMEPLSILNSPIQDLLNDPRLSSEELVSAKPHGAASHCSITHYHSVLNHETAYSPLKWVFPHTKNRKTIFLAYHGWCNYVPRHTSIFVFKPGVNPDLCTMESDHQVRCPNPANERLVQLCACRCPRFN